MKLEICVAPLSPLCLLAGNADVNIDADIVHDLRGLPYFPGRRLKGLLYESALEVAEMMALSGLNLLTLTTVEELFGHKNASDVRLLCPDLKLANYEAIEKIWDYLLKKYENILNSQDVLESYTSLRSQTALDDNQIAKSHSLRTFRALDAKDIRFIGNIQIINGEKRHKEAIVLAMQNLTQAGANRNRGMGKILCSLSDTKEQEQILENILGVD